VSLICEDGRWENDVDSVMTLGCLFWKATTFYHVWSCVRF